MIIKNILFPTDFTSSSDNTLDHAVALAHRYNADLTLLHVETPYSSDPNNPKKEFPDLESLFLFIREQSANRHKDGDIPVIHGEINFKEIVIRNVSAAKGILEYTRENAIDLIVMGTHASKGVKKFIQGSVTEQVIHNSPVPVLSIGRVEDKFIQNEATYKRVLVPIDFSKNCRNILDDALSVVKTFNSEIIFLHVIEPVMSHPALITSKTSPMEIDPDTNRRSLEAFKNFAGDHLPENYLFLLASGKPHREIIGTAKDKDCDLIILGNQGWNRFDRWLLGSTSEKTVSQSPVPVLTLK